MARRIAWVTGAGRGIGRACALALSGDTVEGGPLDVALIARSQDELDAVAAEVRAQGPRAETFVADLLETTGLPILCQRIAADFGPADVLVNNAGMAFSKKLHETTDEDWDRAIRLNMTAPYILSREVLPGMIERRWGRIINVASTAGLRGYAFTAAYTASKHGLVGLTRALALEVEGKGVTVNALCPGWVNSRMTDESVRNIMEKTGRTEEEARLTLARMNPHGRLIEPAEVAEYVVRMAADPAGMITGDAIVIDGSDEGGV